jgi:IclR family acetate operon transcriptional repressor
VGRYSVQAVRRAIAILGEFENCEQLSLRELVARVGMPKPTVFRLVTTLEQTGLLERCPSGSYRLGLKLVSVARLALSRGLPETARPYAEDLSRSFGHTVNVGVLDEGEVLIVQVIESRHNPRVISPVGAREPLHATALGKAIAAHLDAEILRRVLADRPLTPITLRTISSRVLLEHELALTRERGFSTDEGECRVEGHCVAAPLFDSRGIIGAISVSATSSQLPAADFQLVGASVISAARVVSQALGAQTRDFADAS